MKVSDFEPVGRGIWDMRDCVGLGGGFGLADVGDGEGVEA